MTEQPITITLEQVADEWQACYPRDRIESLFDSPKTPLQILTLKEGKWADVPVQDRFWVVLRNEILPDELLRLFACWCTEQAIHLFEKKHPDDNRPRVAIEVARRFAFGEATQDEIDAAKDAARAAAKAAARAAARDAAWDAAGNAALAAA